MIQEEQLLLGVKCRKTFIKTTENYRHILFLFTFAFKKLSKRIKMETVRLNVTRGKSFVGVAMPYKILVNGVELGSVAVGKTVSFSIPKVQSSLKVSMVGNSMTFHRVEKEIVLFPQNSVSGTVNCFIDTKLDFVGFITLGLLQAVGKLDIRVSY